MIIGKFRYRQLLMKNPFSNILNNLLSGPDNVQSGTEGIASSEFKAYNKTREGWGHKTFCYAPSVNMLFAQDGSVKACCHNTEFAIGTYPQQSIKEIWNSTKAAELRDNMSSYKLGHGCDICAMDIKGHGYTQVPARHFDSLPRNESYPIMMEFLLTNQCNLECVMCKGEYSSLIRKNREKLPPIVSPYDAAFLEQLKEFIPHLKETRFSGSGEAFSIDMNYDIWEMIVDQNPDCLIMVQTNGTILTGRVKEALAKGKFQIGVSLDSLKKEVFEAIRINANFDKIMDNIRYFNDYCKQRGTRFSISTCVMRQNWSELPAFIDFCNHLDAVATFHKVWFPEEFALYNLSATELNVIYTHLSKQDFPQETVRQRANREHYQYFTNVVRLWLKDAEEREAVTAKKQAEIRHIYALPITELFPATRSKLQQLIETETTSAAEKEQVLAAAMEKLQTVANMFTDKEEREEVMRRMCTATPAEMLAALKQYPAEVLYQQARKFLLAETSA